MIFFIKIFIVKKPTLSFSASTNSNRQVTRLNNCVYIGKYLLFLLIFPNKYALFLFSEVIDYVLFFIYLHCLINMHDFNSFCKELL